MYWIGGGGGQSLGGNGNSIKSVDVGSTTGEGGVLFYNTAISGSDIGAMNLNGSSSNLQLYPLMEPKSAWESTWNGLIVYQDRDYHVGRDDLTINGSAPLGMNVRGTIYLPDGDGRVVGAQGDLVMDQIISQTYHASGNSGDILALRDEDYIYQFTAVGLVE